jgi:outer membrane protein
MHFRRISFLAGVAAVCLGSSLPAQTTPDTGALSLRDAVVLALEKNPNQRIAAADLAAAHTTARLSRTTLLPSLWFDETITRGNDPVYVFGTKLRQQRFTQNDFALNNLNRPTPINNYTTRFSGNWTAFDFWKTEFAIRQADLQQASAAAASTRTGQETVHRVVAAYEAVLLAARQIEVAQHQVETAEALLAASSSRVDAGMAVDSDRLSAAANLAARQQEQIAAEGALAIAWAELEQAAGAPIPEVRRAARPFSVQRFTAPPLLDAVTQALNIRPDRASLLRQQEAAHAGVQAAHSAFAPVVSTFGSWEVDRESFAGSGGNNWMAGVQLKMDILPIARREELAAAKTAAQRTHAVTDAADNAIRLEVTRAWYAQQTAGRMLDVARSAHVQSEESLRILRNRYDAGLATVTDLLRAEDAERQSAANYWQAAFRNTLAWADLRFAMGTLTADHLEDLQ